MAEHPRTPKMSKSGKKPKKKEAPPKRKQLKRSSISPKDRASAQRDVGGPSEGNPWKLETPAQAKSWLEETIIALQKSNIPGAKQLARKLRKCGRGRPCGSGACPVCVRAYRKRYMEGVSQTLYQYGPFQRLCIVPKGGRVPVGRLRDWRLGRLCGAVNKNLERKGPLSNWLLSGIDVSLNVDLDGSIYFQFHLYILTPELGRDWDGRRLFPPEKRAKRPIYHKCVFDRARYPNVFSYLLKGRFYRRVEYIDQNGRNNARHVSLKPNELVELLLFLDRYPIRTRLLGHRVRITDDKNRLNFQISTRESR